MCHVSTGNQVSQMNNLCSGGCHSGYPCVCRCPLALPVGDEIRWLEEHKKILQDRIDMIDKKITGLKSVNRP